MTPEIDTITPFRVILGRAAAHRKMWAKVFVSRSGSSSESHLVADLRSADEAERVVAEVAERTGRLDIVVNSVGVVAFGDT
ncbi:MAG: SDR family oxidoreductase, partial [Actinomycetota bacterium]